MLAAGDVRNIYACGILSGCGGIYVANRADFVECNLTDC
jgi:hypothetical protein